MSGGAGFEMLSGQGLALLSPNESVDAIRTAGRRRLDELGSDWSKVASWLRTALPKDPEAPSPLHGRGVIVTTSLDRESYSCPFCGVELAGMEFQVELPDGPPGNRVSHPHWETIQAAVDAGDAMEGSLMAGFAETLIDRVQRTTIVHSVVLHLIEIHEFAGGAVPVGLSIDWLVGLERYQPRKRGRRQLPIA